MVTFSIKKSMYVNLKFLKSKNYLDLNQQKGELLINLCSLFENIRIDQVLGSTTFYIWPCVDQLFIYRAMMKIVVAI